MTESPSTPEAQETDDQKKTRAYNAALKRLREAHVDEFNTLRVQESKKLGIEWSPKPTAEQKAEADMEALLKAHPTLLDKFAERLAQRTD